MNDNDMNIINAHTGSVLQISRYYFLSLDELRKFCSAQLNIPKEQLFLLTSLGHKLRASSLEHVDEIYVFDKNLFSTDGSEDTIQRYLKSMYTEGVDTYIRPINSPLLDIDLNRLAKSKDARQLMGLLTTNLGWIAAIESDSALYLKKALELKSKVEMMFKSVKVASLYTQAYYTDVKKIYDSTLDFLNHLQKQSLNIKWADHYNLLENIKTLDDLPLSGLLDKSLLSEGASESVKLNRGLNSTLTTQRTRLTTSLKLHTEVDGNMDTIELETRKMFSTNEGESWLATLMTLCGEAQRDTRHLLDQTKNAMDNLSIDLMLETFQLHKEEYVSNIYNLSYSLYKMLTSYKEVFTKLQLSIATFLKKLSESQSEMVTLKESLRSLGPQIERVQDLESSLAHTIDVPLLYGLYIIEGVRRFEWLKNVKQEASRANEEFATIREKEIKLRTSWVKNYGDILKLLNKNISSFSNDGLTSFELIMNKDSSNEFENSFTYEDVQRYVEQLQRNEVSSEIVQALFNNLEDIPSKLAKKASASKGVSRDSVIQGYKIRIKKLENLLHQEQFKNFQQWPSSDRFSSISRLSVNNNLNSSSLRDSTCKNSISALSNSGELTKVTEENRTLNNNIKRHKNTIEVLNKELKNLKHQLSTREFEQQALQNNLEKLKDEHSSEISKFRLKLSQEEVKTSTLEDEVANLKGDLEVHESKSISQEKTINNLKGENQKKIIIYEEQLKSKDFELETLRKVNVDQGDIDALKVELEEMRRQMKEKDHQLKEAKQALSIREKDLNKQAELLTEKDNIIKKMDESATTELETWKRKSTELQEQNEALTNRIEISNENYERLKSMKNDLLENMSNRENEFASEKGSHQKEMEAMKLRIEELENKDSQTDAEISRLNELISKQSHSIFQLVVIINSLIIKSRDLSDILVTFYDLFCATLKSMGLLAVRSEANNGITIMRVKGLRKGNYMSATVDVAAGFKSDLEQVVHKCAIWTELPDKQLLELGGSESELGSDSISSIVEMLIETYNLTTFEDKYLKFVNLVTNLNDLYLSSISKRFKEVEHLAKKELKENKMFRESESKKISIRNFKRDDMVLFLPTRSNDVLAGSAHSWAVFNDMGDVKYLLKNEVALSTQKQWFIGRILQIEEVNKKESLITAEEVVFN
jgi:autophagy-related protein 11